MRLSMLSMLRSLWSFFVFRLVAFGVWHNQIVVIGFCEYPILYRFCRTRARARRAVFLFVELGLPSFARWHAYNQCGQNKIAEFYFGQIFVWVHRLTISIIRIGQIKYGVSRLYVIWNGWINILESYGGHTTSIL